MRSGATGISIDSVSRHYETPAGFVRAVDGITLEVESGTSVAITGPSGCGKSTLLALIAGLEVPTAGSVVVGGKEISALSEADRARVRRDEFGLAFQADNLLPFLTVVENVALQLALHGARDGYDRCLEMLERLGVGDQAHKLPDQLSGGQRQRVAIARALIHGPRAILADEPTGSLDAESSAGVLELLVDAKDEMKATLVVVTHDPTVAARLDRSVVLSDGRLVDSACRALALEREPAGA